MKSRPSLQAPRLDADPARHVEDLSDKALRAIELDENTEREAYLDYEASRQRLAEILQADLKAAARGAVGERVISLLRLLGFDTVGACGLARLGGGRRAVGDNAGDALLPAARASSCREEREGSAHEPPVPPPTTLPSCVREELAPHASCWCQICPATNCADPAGHGSLGRALGGSPRPSAAAGRSAAGKRHGQLRPSGAGGEGGVSRINFVIVGQGTRSRARAVPRAHLRPPTACRARQ
jgi:hypothetical protein